MHVAAEVRDGRLYANVMAAWRGRGGWTRIQDCDRSMPSQGVTLHCMTLT